MRIAFGAVAAGLAASLPLALRWRRSGAERWGLFRDGDDPDVFLETFVVPTWKEHSRQHLERPTASDRESMAAPRALQDGDGEVEVHHLLLGLRPTRA